MKKWIVRIVIGLVVLLVVIVGVSMFYLGDIVKKGVETLGPEVTQTDVKLKSAEVMLFAGSVHLTGLEIGNPKNYSSTNAISIGDISVTIVPSSALSQKAVIKEFEVKSPHITVEGTLQQNNLQDLQKNINAYTAKTPAAAQTPAPKSAPPEEKAQSKTFEVDDLLITNAQVHLIIAGPMNLKIDQTLTLPAIHLTNLGTGPNGVTGAEIAQDVLNEINKAVQANAADLLSKAAGNISSQLKDATKNLDGKKAEDTLKGLFGK